MEVKRSLIIKNIILVYCYFVNYEREYCWKQMKNFLLQEGKTIFKFFLEIIYSDTIYTKFSNLENYFFYDNDEEFGLPSYFDKIDIFENYYKFFLTNLGDCNNMILKHRIKIINGSIYFIGMSLWGYERIESIQIPNSVVVSHFFKLASSSHRKIDNEIIQCLKRLIKKFGDILTDEWTQIFQILQMIISREKMNPIVQSQSVLSQSALGTFNSQNFNTSSHSQNLYDKHMMEILDATKNLIVSNKFFGNLNSFSNLLDDFKTFQNESLSFLKTKFKLGNFCKFIANLESLIIENLNNSKSERIKNHILEMIRLNYSYIFHKNQLQTMKRSIIENLISKHFSSIIYNFETAENLNYISHFITEMCVFTQDLKFFKKIITQIFYLQNDLKFYQNDNEKSKSMFGFQKNTLINLYKSLSNSFQKEKMMLINKKIYTILDSKNEKSDISLLIVILNYFKNFTVNKDYELFIQDDKIYKNNLLPSQVVINYHYNTIIVSKKNKKVYENLKSKKVNVYEPYIVFKHNKIYDFLIHLINQDETNTFVCEEVLELLLIHLKTTFFFKGLKLEKLLHTIIGINDIKKYSIRKRFIDLITEILTNSTFHLNVNKDINKDGGSLSNLNNINLISNASNSATNFTSSSSNFNINSNLPNFNLPSIEISDESLKEKIINFSINSLKSFQVMIKNMITNYKKIVMNYLNLQNSAQSCKSELKHTATLKEKDPNLVTSEIFTQSMTMNTNNPNMNPNNTNAILNLNIHINNITENFVENSQILTNLNSQNSLSNVNLKLTVYYLKRILNLIAVYLSSINVQNNNFVNNNKNLSGFYGYNTNFINFNNFTNFNFSSCFNNLNNNNNLINFNQNFSNYANFTNYLNNQKKLNEGITALIEILTEMRSFCFFKLSIAVVILNFIISIKEIIISSGEENVIKMIFLILNIGYPNYEGEILKLFTENFNYKFKKFEIEKIRPGEKFMKREYVNLLSDTSLLYFIENSQHGRILMNILNLIFRNPNSSNAMGLQYSNYSRENTLSNPTSLLTNQLTYKEKNPLILMRENIFLELAKWQIHSKTNRDNIKSEYRNKIPLFSQIYIGKQNIIMIIPLDARTMEVLIRNPIANINMTITSEIDNIDQKDSNSQVIMLNDIINNKNYFRDADKMKSELNNRNDNFNNDNEYESPFKKKRKKSDAMNYSEVDEENESIESSLIKSGSKYPEVDDTSEHQENYKLFQMQKSANIVGKPPSLLDNLSVSTIYKQNSAIINTTNLQNATTNDLSPKNDVRNLLTVHTINNTNIIFLQILNMISEQDTKLQLLENNSQLERYIQNLDNTPVYYTFNCGVIYIPNKSNLCSF